MIVRLSLPVPKYIELFERSVYPLPESTCHWYAGVLPEAEIVNKVVAPGQVVSLAGEEVMAGAAHAASVLKESFIQFEKVPPPQSVLTNT